MIGAEVEDPLGALLLLLLVHLLLHLVQRFLASLAAPRRLLLVVVEGGRLAPLIQVSRFPVKYIIFFRFYVIVCVEK